MFNPVADIVNPDLFACVCRTWIDAILLLHHKAMDLHILNIHLEGINIIIMSIHLLLILFRIDIRKAIHIH